MILLESVCVTLDGTEETAVSSALLGGKQLPSSRPDIVLFFNLPAITGNVGNGSVLICYLFVIAIQFATWTIM